MIWADRKSLSENKPKTPWSNAKKGKGDKKWTFRKKVCKPLNIKSLGLIPARIRQSSGLIFCEAGTGLF